MKFFWVMLLILSPVSAGANSDVIGLRNDFNSSMDSYRSESPAHKCSYFDNARTYADLVMREGADATLAKKWNAMLPSTGCRLTPLIIDRSAVNTSENPDVNAGSALAPHSMSQTSLPPMGGCLSFQEIMTIDVTRQVQKRCPGGGLVYIKAH